MTSLAAKANESLDLTGKTACVAGGTQGIGRGVAGRFASAGANVVVVGRTERDVISELKKLGKSEAKFDFVKADMSLTTGIKDAVEKIKAASPNGVDYLVMTQGVTPNGRYEETSQGIESRFAIQCLSKFGLAYGLLANNHIKDSVVSIAAPGGNDKEFDGTDPHLKKAKAEGRYGFFLSAARDGLVIDAFTEELATRYPRVRFYHCFPGFVATQAVANSGWAWPLATIASIGGKIVGQSPATYANIPVYLSANPEAKSEITSRYLNQKLKPIPMNAWSAKAENRKVIFDTMKQLLDS